MLRGEVFLFLIGTVVVASLLLREAQLFVVGVILLLVAGVSFVWERYCLVGLGYRRSLGQARAMFGEEVSLTLEIVNDKPLPLAWLEIEDTVPGVGLTLAPAHVGPSHIPGRRLLGILLSVRWYERVRRHYRVLCQARGFHAFGPATMRTGDVFGLATQEIEIPQEDYLLVYPKIVPLERLGLPARNPFGDVPLRRQWLFEDPMRTVGVRDYRPGDSPRRLHWKATARAPGQALQVKLFEPTTTHRLHVLLNISTGGPNWSWQGYDPEVLEAVIATAASVANWATEHGFLIGLAANAKLFRSSAAVRIPPSRDPRQMMHVLEALARLVPMATMSAETLVELEGHELAYGTTVVMVTAFANQDLVNQLQRLRRAGHQPAMLLITSAEEPLAPLNGLPAYAIRVEDTQ
ncbi:MAG TPA: DUF58 domain-containing protein [Chloroflexota bacterium]|nr:DUF58 domain-containing protein [Chloroflexota bacterium]